MNMVVIKNLIKVTFAAFTEDIYMSTRISDNEALGWRRCENKLLSYERKKIVETLFGKSVLNPVTYNQGMPESWTHEKYMRMWRYVLSIMRFRKCKMVAFKEDLTGSIGCQEEVTLGLPITIL